MNEKPIENAATREARKRGVKGAFRPSMTDAERQEAERVWREIVNELSGTWPLLKYDVGGVRAVAAARVRWQNEARWISVKERVPEEAESVLVTWFRKGMAKPVIMCGHYVADPGEITWFRDWTAEVIHPTHWMPLPSPP